MSDAQPAIQKKEWNQSYRNGDNNILYPQTEVIRFINRFVCKRNNDGTVSDLLPRNRQSPLKGLDFACGVGTHCLVFNDFGIEGYGVDISDVAIQIAKNRSVEKGLDEEKFLVLDGGSQLLPFEDDFFDFVVAESCLDSMPYNVAKNYVAELTRVTKNLIYASFIGFDKDISQSEFTVSTRHEFGTTQTVFDDQRIAALFNKPIEEFAYFTRIDQIDPVKNLIAGSRYYGVLALD